MTTIIGSLWEYNFAKVVFVDVSDDYRLMQPPMPSAFYPVIKEEWLPTHDLAKRLSGESLVQGYLYDWHEIGDNPTSWYVGVVAKELAREG